MNPQVSPVDTGSALKIDFLRSLLIHEINFVVAVAIREENSRDRLYGSFFAKVI
jgi:hypothetical protein